MLKFLKGRLARYVLVRDVIARMVADLNCTEAEAALALSALLTDAGTRAPSWFDIEDVKAGHPIVPFNASKLTLMLLQLQQTDPEYDPRLTRDEIWDVWGGDEGGYKNLMLEHCEVHWHYFFACFLCEEIEPMLHDAELLTVPPVPSGGQPASIGKSRRILTDAQVQVLRERWLKGGEDRAKLAVELGAEFGVSRQAIKKRLDKLDEEAALQPTWLPRLATK